MEINIDLYGYRAVILCQNGYDFWKSDGHIISPLVRPFFSPEILCPEY